MRRRDDEWSRREEERADYHNDVFYDVWRSGGDPDRIDYDRVNDRFYDGISHEGAANSELRAQRPREPEPEYPECEPEYPDEPIAQRMKLTGPAVGQKGTSMSEETKAGSELSGGLGRDQEDDEIHVGDMVETAVYVCNVRRPMGQGRVVAVHSGYCDVDHCYPYGKPWIYGEVTSHLRKIPKAAQLRS